MDLIRDYTQTTYFDSGPHLIRVRKINDENFAIEYSPYCNDLDEAKKILDRIAQRLLEQDYLVTMGNECFYFCVEKNHPHYKDIIFYSSHG